MYLTRNKKDEVVLFEYEPNYVEEWDEWHENELGGHTGLRSDDYPEVTFENSPLPVELVIKKNGNEARAK